MRPSYLAIAVALFFAAAIESGEIDPSANASDPLNELTPEQRRIILHQRFNPRRNEIPVDPEEWVRDDPKNRDDANTRRWRDAMKECGPEADRFRASLTDFEKLPLSQKVRGGAAWSELTSKAETYSTACLESFEKQSPPRQLDNLLGSVGILTDTNEAFCGAVALTDTVIVTARHCFYSMEGEIPNDFQESLKEGRVSFTTLSSSSPTIRIESIRTTNSPAIGAGRITHLDDYIFLNLSAPIQAFVPIPRSSNYSGGEVHQVWLPGPFRFAYLPNSANTAAAARASVRWSRTGSCPATVPRSGCIQHACQSVGGFSGSPLLELHSDGKVTLLGLHRQANDGTGFCAVSKQESGNFALATERIPNPTTSP